MVVPLNRTRPRVDDVPAKPTAAAKNGPTLELTHERVDDVPLLLGFLIKLRIPEIVDRQFPPHPLHQGLSNGWLITVWLAYILSQADHRKSPVQQWVESLKHTLETLIGQPIRPVDFSDDRLTLVLKRLSDTAAWNQLEAALWAPSARSMPCRRWRGSASTPLPAMATTPSTTTG